MSEQSLGALPSDHSNGEAISIAADRPELHLGHAGIPPEDLENARTLAQMAREQLARDIADIEQASAALRRAEPALESWTKPMTPAAAKPQPLWLLIGILWLSTALVTVGAVAAIASFAG